MKNRLWKIYASPGFTWVIAILAVIFALWACFKVPIN